jgi:hypothetical protein
MPPGAMRVISAACVPWELVIASTTRPDISRCFMAFLARLPISRMDLALPAGKLVSATILLLAGRLPTCKNGGRSGDYRKTQ